MSRTLLVEKRRTKLKLNELAEDEGLETDETHVEDTSLTEGQESSYGKGPSLFNALVLLILVGGVITTISIAATYKSSSGNGIQGSNIISNECSIPLHVNNSNPSGPCRFKGENTCCSANIMDDTFDCGCQCGYASVENGTDHVLGFLPSTDSISFTCDDIDECALYSSQYLCPSSPYSVCINTPGSYCCFCGAGYNNSIVTSLNVDTLYITNDCPCGVQATCTAQCTDLDECLLETDRCQYATVELYGGQNLTCENTQGSYICIDYNGTVIQPDNVE